MYTHVACRYMIAKWAYSHRQLKLDYFVNRFRPQNPQPSNTAIAEIFAAIIIGCVIRVCKKRKNTGIEFTNSDVDRNYTLTKTKTVNDPEICFYMYSNISNLFKMEIFSASFITARVIIHTTEYSLQVVQYNNRRPSMTPSILTSAAF